MSHSRVEGGRSHAGDLAVDTRAMMDGDGVDRHEDLGAGRRDIETGQHDVPEGRDKSRVTTV